MKTVSVAFCYSLPCVSEGKDLYKDNSSAIRRYMRDMPISKDICPHCHNYVKWFTITEDQFQVMLSKIVTRPRKVKAPAPKKAKTVEERCEQISRDLMNKKITWQSEKVRRSANRTI